MSPTVIAALLALVAEAIKDAPAIIAEIEKMISDAKGGSNELPGPIAPGVVADMADVLAKLDAATRAGG